MALEELDPEIKTNIQPSPEKRKRRKQSAQELSNAFGKVVGGTTGGGMSGMGNMGNMGKAPDAVGLAKTAIKLYSMMGSDKKLKKNIKTISNFKEILYG
tara:strand:- start:142 stop:438 length:297 start_codon:yes stop_codon:yes gene_type:complete